MKEESYPEEIELESKVGNEDWILHINFIIRCLLFKAITDISLDRYLGTLPCLIVREVFFFGGRRGRGAFIISPLFSFNFHEIYLLGRKTIKNFFSNNVDIEAQGT